MQFVFRGSGQKNCPLPKLCLGLIVALSLFPGCSKPHVDETTPGLAIKHQISPYPPRVGTDTLTLNLANATGTPITKARIALEADMLHPGMAPRSFDVKEVGGGQYQAQMQFEMAGDWVVLLHVTLPDGNTLNRQFDVTGVQPK
jgi:YtkA-like